MKNDLELQSMIGSLQQINLKSEIREGLETLIRDLQALNDEYQKEILRIDTDERLTSIGRKERKQEISTELMDELKTYHGVYDEHISQAETALLNGGDKQTKKSSTERLLDYMRQSEIRRMYGVEKMDPLEVEAHADDPLFIEAILTSPKKLLPQEHIDKLVMRKAEKEQPELAVEMEQLNYANNAVKGIRKTLQANVESNGWRDPENPLNQELKPAHDPVKEAANA